MSDTKNTFLQRAKMKAKSGSTLENFENILWSLKFVGIFLLVAAAIVNVKNGSKHTLWNTKPVRFFIESVIFALTTVLSYLVLVYLRYQNPSEHKNDIVKISIAIFVIFVIINYLLDMSGATGYFFESPTDSKEDKEEIRKEFVDAYSEASAITMAALIAFAIIVIIVITIYIHQVPKDSYGGFCLSDKCYKWNKYLMLFVESLIIGTLAAIPVLPIAYNRKDPLKDVRTDFGLVILKFFILNLLLQFSGLYNHIFN